MMNPKMFLLLLICAVSHGMNSSEIEWITNCYVAVGPEKIETLKNSPCVAVYNDINLGNGSPIQIYDKFYNEYCRKADEIKKCVDLFVAPLETCKTDQLKLIETVTILKNVVLKGFEFLCSAKDNIKSIIKDGKLTACFEKTKDTLKTCDPNLKTYNFNDDNCKDMTTAHKCVVDATKTCDDQMISQTLDGLFTQMMDVTPCQSSSSSVFHKHIHAFLPHFLAVIATGLSVVQLFL